MNSSRGSAWRTGGGTGAGVLLALGLALVLGPWTAGAAPESVRLLPEHDMGGRGVPPRWMALEWAVGAGTAAVTVPGTLALGAWVGSLSSNVVLAAGPALLLLVALPPLAVVLAETWLGNRLQPGSARLGPAVGVALGVQVLVVLGAVLLGATVHSVADAALFTLVEVLVLPSAVTWTLRLTAPERPAAALWLPDPPRTLMEAAASRTPVLPLFRRTF